jgi:hypothetical protein
MELCRHVVLHLERQGPVSNRDCPVGCALPGLFMNTCSVVRSSHPAWHFSFGLRDGLGVRLRRPHLREATAGFGLERLAAAFMNNPG